MEFLLTWAAWAGTIAGHGMYTGFYLFIGQAVLPFSPLFTIMHLPKTENTLIVSIIWIIIATIYKLIRVEIFLVES